MNKRSLPIWRLIEASAQELTKSGAVPFTRQDLIRGVQRHRPDCGPDSVNPIIQGMTDNLRGGASSGASRPILHSVGRGLFVLAQERSQPTKPASASRPAVKTKPVAPAPRRSASTRARVLQGVDFQFVCAIEPECAANGRCQRLMPQSQFANSRGLKIHRYGHGPFCRFRIPSDYNMSGVYLLTVNQQPTYLGECQHLSQRYNMGYGQISPRNCFVGGQQTNCRLNHQILMAAEEDSCIELWFHECDDYKVLEADLRRRCRLPWNRI